MTAGAFTAEVEGAVLAGEARGDAPALVMLHGFGGSRLDWDRLWSALPGDLPMLRYDLRGFGQSTDGEAAFSHTEDLLALLDARGIARAVLIGVSAGGATALNFALGHPGCVERLILVSPAMVAWDWSDEWKTLWRGMTDAARAGDLPLARKLWWQHPLFATTRASEAVGELHEGIEAFDCRQWIKDWQRDELPDVDRLHELAVSTLLCTGERDLPDFRLIADILEAAAPQLHRIDFADAGHMLHFERPRELARAVAEFLG